MTTISAGSFDLYKETASGGTKSYDQFVEEMNNAGIKTTHINEGEANFADYGNALSDDLKKQIMDSYDCERDYEMQAMIAGIYADRGTNFLKWDSFMNACRDLGFSVNIEYQETSYIPDWKAGNYNNVIREEGLIAVYTISDGMGGEIIVADANGNAALESEELFMNQILGDINYEISATKGVGEKVDYSSGNYDNAVAENGLFGKDVNSITNNEYNSTVEKYYAQYGDLEIAIQKANIETDNFAGKLSYTGNIKEKSDKNKKSTDIKETAIESAKKETNDSKVIDEVVAETVDKKEETDDYETIADFASEIAEDIIKSINIFAA